MPVDSLASLDSAFVERVAKTCQSLAEDPGNLSGLVAAHGFARELGLDTLADGYAARARGAGLADAGIPAGAPRPEETGPARFRVSIIVLCRDQLAYTRQCLTALRRTVPPGLAEIIVVDNGSTDGTLGWARSQPGVTVIHNPENRGFGPANNQAAAQASGEYLLFLNNDTIPQHRWLESLLTIVDADDRIGAVGARVVSSDGLLLEAGAVVNLDGTCTNRGREAHQSTHSYGVVSDVPYASACCLLVRKSAFQRINGFDDRYAPAYYEDVDLCVALRTAGFRVVYQPAAWVVHAESVTARAVTGSEEWRLKLQEAARAKFLAKWAGSPVEAVSDAVAAVRAPILPRPIRVAILIPYDGPDCLWGEAMNGADMREALEWRTDVREVRLFSYATASQIDNFQPDLILSWTAWRQPLRFKSGVTLFYIVNFVHEHLPAGQALTWEDALSLDADIYAANSPAVVAKLAECKPTRLLHLAANPRVHRPMGVSPRYRADVAYLGSYNPGTKGQEVFDRYVLPAAGRDLALWGEMWDRSPEVLRRRWRGVLPTADIARLYSSVDVAIGFNAASQAQAGMVNNRVFEVLSCGALLLSDKMPAIENFFGDCAVFTDGYGDTREKLEYYLSHPEERLALGRLARQTILEGHTYDHRARDVIGMYAEYQRGRGEL